MGGSPDTGNMGQGMQVPQGQFNALNQMPNVGSPQMPQMGGGGGQKGGSMGMPQQGGSSIPNEPLQMPNGGVTPIGQPNSPYGPLTPPPQGLQPAQQGPQEPLTPPPQGLTPAGNQPGPGGSLIGPSVGTAYWQQQYQQNPGNVQNYFSPPAANQLGRFYPGQQIFPGVQGTPGAQPPGHSGGMGGGQNKGPGQLSPTAGAR